MKRLMMLFSVLVAAVARGEEWTPEAHYADTMGGREDEDASAEIAKWAGEPSTGPAGRPLPLAGSWNTEAWGPAYFEKLIQEGHHVLLTFTDPSGVAERSLLSVDPRQKTVQGEKAVELMAEYYRPGLEYARQHKLPICFRGWNWAANVTGHQEKRIQLGKQAIPDEQRANALVDGKVDPKVTDPFGPVAAWREWGRFWLGHALMKEIQSVYPDPPLVIFLNNNEAGELNSSAGVESYDRFIARYGKEPRSREFMDKAAREGYEERYAALFAAAREAATTPAWRTNTRFIAYNTLAGTAYIGNGKQPKPGVGFDAEKGWTEWRIYDGSMPELYDNDWQPGKLDIRPDGMQAEAGNYHSMQARVFAERPDFFWTTIFWDGGVPSAVFRGRRATSKPYRYAQSGGRWDFARYEGWVQFCLWATRPRLAYEFRAGEPLDATRKGTWMALLDSVDRPWKNKLLAEFWRFGELVPNTAERPWHDELPEEAPPWLKDLNRWYLLACDANPPRETWEKGVSLSVFAQALVLGKEPKRRWLVNAHAPAGGVSNVKVTVPGYGDAELPVVPRRGSFYLLNEGDRALKPVWNGGPDELTLTTTNKWVAPGQSVTFKVRATKTTGSFVWDFGDGETLEQKTLADVTHPFKKPGTYWVGVKGTLADQTAVFVGTPPDASVVYDLPLDDAIAWEGPWAGVGTNGQTLATYRHVPNRGSAPVAIVTGGQFVTDAVRGRVFELTDDWGGLWLKRDKQTVLTGQDGAPNRTVSLWFKAEDVTRRQVLCASGMESVGMNTYLDKGTLYAGSWATVDGVYGNQDPIYGHNWKGNWIHAGPIETGKWYQVTWVLKDGANKVEPDKQSLYLNGKLVGKAPGASIPVEYVVPRVGRSTMDGADGRPLTRFHDQDELEKSKRGQVRIDLPTFRGRIDDFRFVNAAEAPVAAQ